MPKAHPSLTKSFCRFLLACFCLCAPKLSHAEAFGNQTLAIPKVGLTLFDKGIPHKKPWGLDLQWSVGTSFSHAISYRFFWTAETSVGFGRLTVGAQPYLATFLGGAGLRFNFWSGDLRPYAGLSINYLQFLGEGRKAIPLNLDWPIFVGLKPSLGLEWIFFSEMALLMDANYTLYVNINEPLRHTLSASLSYAIYF